MTSSAKSPPTRKPRHAAAAPSPTGRVSPVLPLPHTSVHKAAKAFKHFSLSRFPKNATPHNYVSGPTVRDATTVQSVQRKSMAHQVSTLPKDDPANSGMTIALPAGSITDVLPSFKSGTVDLGELLSVLRQKMQGTEFYTAGNPTLTRLTLQSQLQSQVSAIIATIKQRAPK